jgi:proline iminopeptidase
MSLKAYLWLLALTFALVAGCQALQPGRFVDDRVSTDSREALQQRTKLFPPIEPFESGYLKVSDLHEIYYELCGNPQGKPIFMLHGGPGCGCTTKSRRYFDPRKFLIVLHDQRGCGRSKPLAELEGNTTQALVEDIERLRLHLNLGRIVVTGRSWGSTLGLAYGEAYPQNVSGMVLTGIWMATQAETDHFYGDGVRLYFPEAVAKVEEVIPPDASRPSAKQLLELLRSGDPEVRRKTAQAWDRYETTVAFLRCPQEQLEALEDWDPYAYALIENHYLAHGCFLEEGQLWRDVDRLKDIPITLVNGRYDVICPPITAYRLHERLPNSKLDIVEQAGHALWEGGTYKSFLQAVAEFE